MPGPEIVRRAQMLVEETREKVDGQREIVANLERRGLDPIAARKLLTTWEEALIRRVEILDEMRARSREKRDGQ
jgi:hypothetical protein